MDCDNNSGLTDKQERRRREYWANPEKAREDARQWRKNNPEKFRLGKQRWKEAHLEQHRKLHREYRRRNADRLNERNKSLSRTPHRLAAKRRYTLQSTLSLKQQTMQAYGGHCACCGETQIEFLTLDYINNDGGARRKAGLDGIGKCFYAKLRKAGFPPRPDLQVLCCNCNFAKRFHGVCPHQMNAMRLVIGACA